MDDFQSNYYPPRARWYSPLLVRRDILWQKLIRPLPSMELPDSITVPAMIGGFFVPGLAFYLHGWRRFGVLAMTVCGLLSLLFLIFLGYPFATYIFGALISIHTSGLITYCRPLLAREDWHIRLVGSFSLYLAVIFLLYVPGRGLVENHLFVPLRVHEKVIVVQKLSLPGSIARGDWIAYHTSELDEGNVRIRAGMGFGEVLALPGDTVDFGPATFTVLGTVYPTRDHMPGSGQIVVPENCWFVWPDFATSGHGIISASTISTTIMAAAMVPKTQFVGKPFRRWFGRRQIPS